MLTANELDALRHAVLAVMPDSVQIQRYNMMADRWDTVATTVCRVMPRRSVTRDSYGTLRGITLWNVLMPHDAPVLANDRLVVGTRTYTVSDTDAGRSEAVATVVQCNRIA
ncbi:MAG: hypothetical protein GX446_03325 [Chthonomonadales bacterium]|nr:hypothetical protein [Chthonomonadales bacterium]